MILALSGYIGSGKDLVGKIIQYLDIDSKFHNISKTNWTPEQLLAGDLDTALFNSDWRIKKFAGKLKKIASLLTGIPVENFEDQEFKKKTFKQLVDEGYINQDILNLLRDVGL